MYAERVNLDAGRNENSPHEPILILANGNISSGSGESRISFDIYNSSAFPAFQVEAQVLLQQQNSTVPVDMIPQQATVTVEWKGSIEGLDGVHRFEEQSAIGLKKRTLKRLAIPLREINDVVVLCSDKRRRMQSLIEAQNTTHRSLAQSVTLTRLTTTVTLNGLAQSGG